MMDGLLLQSIEGLEDSLTVRTSDWVWDRLQGEKQTLAMDLMAEGPLCQSAGFGLQETEPSEENWREIEWHHRGQLEARLRELNDAQDRLTEGGYGWCADCGKAIDTRRLGAVPEATLCITCQRSAEPEFACCTL
jgi:RNA polymerase-binding transcription factor DksA